MKRIFFLFIACLLSTNDLFPQYYTIYGIISDSESGELLPGTAVYINALTKGTVSNKYGFYSITLPKGTYSIDYSFLGYHNVYLELALNKDTVIDIRLPILFEILDEVTITAPPAHYDKIKGLVMGYEKLDVKEIRSIPGFTGEPDVLKSIQFLPGIQVSNEGTTNLSIRGGSYDQNLILLDEAPVYNSSHALGFFSTFNSDAIRNVSVYKGVFPAQYGGRLSSVIDISMKEGNNQKFSCKGGIGLISSRLSFEGPIIKNKLSFIISGRYSYAGHVVNSLIKTGQFLNLYRFRNFNDRNEIGFYDINAKINYQLDTRNRFYLSAYFGRDHFYYYDISNISSMDWGNITGSFRWNHIFSSKIFANTMLIYSTYDYAYLLKDDNRHFKWFSNIKEYGAKTDIDYYVNPDTHIKTGLSANYRIFQPGSIEPRDSSCVIKSFSLSNKYGADISFYSAMDRKISDKLSVSMGLRYGTFINLGPGKVYSYDSRMNNIIDSTYYSKGEIIKFYHGLEPRVSANYQINEMNSIKCSYGRTIQYLHLISNSSIGLPTDVWLPPNKYIKPQKCNQYSVGYYREFLNKKVTLSAELYYKELRDIIDYKDNADLFLNKQIETQILPGKGTSYGLELFFEKTAGNITGWIGYSFSNTSYLIKGANNNRPYHPKFDIRQNISVFINYPVNDKLSLSTVFKLTSGGYITMPEGYFNYYGASFNYYTSRNGFKLPPYHRLDISLTYQNKLKNKNMHSEWIFSVLNVYARKNIFSLFVVQGGSDLNEARIYKIYLYGIVPTITYNFSF